MKIFVTGHHRAGTHEQAGLLEKQTGLRNINEHLYMFDDMEMLEMLIQGKFRLNPKDKIKYYPDLVEKGFILQCPGLACHLPYLSELGDVYWCHRDIKHIAQSQAVGGFNQMLWEIMKSFNKQYPDDPIWEQLQYKDREDVHSGFLGYAYLLAQVKEYFFNKYFKCLVKEKIKLEDQSYYDFNKTRTSRAAYRFKKQERIDRVVELNESICVY